MVKRTVFLGIGCVLFFASVTLALAAEDSNEITVACSANFTDSLKMLAVEYEKTGGKITCVFGSTGMLYGQIINGAAFDLFLAADEERPEMLFSKNLAYEPQVYATGKAVLWSMKKELMQLSTWKEVLESPTVAHVGISNPKIAPYGASAEAVLRAEKLYSNVKGKFAMGKSVGTAFQYGYSGVAEAAFIALSQALSEKGLQGQYWDLPHSKPIKQAACVLRSGNVEGAKKFMKWLGRRDVRAMLGRYGYE